MIKTFSTEHFYYFRAFYMQLLAAVLMVSGLALYGASGRFLESVAWSSGVMSLNVGVLSWALKNLIQKKYIAFSVTLIVFKWAILALSIYSLMKFYEVIGLVVGLTTVVPGFLLWLVTGNPFKERDE